MDIDPVVLAEFRAALLGEELDPSERLVLALRRHYARESGPSGHQATAAERAGAYRQFAEARERLYGRPPEAERVRNSLGPEGASPMVRRLFGGG